MTDHLVLAFLGGLFLGAIGVIIFLGYNYRLIDRDMWERMCRLMDDHPHFGDIMGDEP